MKFHKLIIFILLTIFLCSCAEINKKEDAYCFSIIFDKNNGAPSITMFCKTDDKQQENSLKDTPLTFSGTSFKKALQNAENSDKKIYYSSTKAIYFSDNLSRDEIFDIVVLLLNQSKYQTSVYVYTPELISAQNLHSEAANVCKNESINHKDKDQYTYLGKFIKAFDSEGNFND